MLKRHFLEKIFLSLKVLFFSCLSCVRPLIRSSEIFYVQKISHRRKRLFPISHSVFQYLSSVLPIKRSLVQFYVKKTIYRKCFFLIFKFFSCLFCLSPLIRSSGIFYVKTVFHKNTKFFIFKTLFYSIFPVYYH